MKWYHAIPESWTFQGIADSPTLLGAPGFARLTLAL
jgi:hypothetical protein